MIYGIILAAGSGSRTMLQYNKVLHFVGTKTILQHSIDQFVKAKVANIILVVRQQDRKIIDNIILDYKNINIDIVQGGTTRFESVKNALNSILDYSTDDIVTIHDGARPFASVETIVATIDSAIKNSSGIAALPTVDTIAVIKNGTIANTLDRTTLCNISTPQSFNLQKLKQAYAKAKHDSYTDDSSVFLDAGFVPYITNSNPQNKKITTVGDIVNLSPTYKIGVGFDVHRLTKGRKLILGGVQIPYHLGLLGHSDADVLTHAIIDAILSANGLPDIGVQFPDSDNSYKDSDSIKLLKVCLQKIRHKISYVSAVIIAQNPKLAKHIPNIENTLATVLQIKPNQIKISATTTEHLGIIGENQAIASSALVLCSDEFSYNIT